MKIKLNILTMLLLFIGYIVPVEGNDDSLIEVKNHELGVDKVVEVNIEPECSRVNLESGSISPQGSTSCKELSNNWRITPLKVGHVRPVSPLHNSAPSLVEPWLPVTVPGGWHRQFPETYPKGLKKGWNNYSYASNPTQHYVHGWYENLFKTPVRSKPSFRTRIEFTSVAYEAHVFVNGKFCIMHRGSFTPFSVDVTDFLNPVGQENELLIWVYNDYGESPPAHAYGAMFSYKHNKGGIGEPVYIKTGPPVDLIDLRIDSDVANQQISISGLWDGVLGCKLDKTNLVLRILDENQNPVNINYQCTVNSEGVEATIDASSLNLWSPDSPVLYRVHIILFDENNNLVSHTVQRFGYRTFEVKGNKFYLNQKRVRLYFGNIFTGPTQRPDCAEGYTALVNNLKRQKAQGVNSIRYHMTRSYASSVFDIFDEVGLLAIDEFPVFHRVFGGIEDEKDRMQYLKNVLAEQREFIYRDYSHPSIVLWCMSNEVWHNNLKNLYSAFYSQAKQIESGIRPVCPTSGLNSFGVPVYPVDTDWFDDHNYDTGKYCATLMDVSVQRRFANVRELYGRIDKPWLISEFQVLNKVRIKLTSDYLSDYIKHAKYQSLRYLSLKEHASPDMYSNYLNVAGKRVYEVFRKEPLFQGFHPWYDDRGMLPQWYNGLTGPYSVMMDPLKRNLHWFNARTNILDIVVMKDPEEEFNGSIEVTIVDHLGENIDVSSKSVVCALKKLQDKWQGQIELSLNSSVPNGEYLLILRLLDSEGNILSNNEYTVWKLPDVDPLDKELKDPVGFFGDSRYLEPLKQHLCPEWSWRKIEKVGELDDFNKIVVLPGALKAMNETFKNKQTTGRLREWLLGGGRLLVLSQKDACKLEWLTGYKIDDPIKTGGIFADILVDKHPIFDGLTRPMFYDFTGHKNLVFPAGISPLNKNALMASGKNCVLFDATIGSGEIILSQIDALSRLDIDPVASRYLRNLFDYFGYNRISPTVKKLVEPNCKAPAFYTELKWNSIDISVVANRRTEDQQGALIGLLDVGSLDFKHSPTGTNEFFGVEFNLPPPDNLNLIALKGTQAKNMPDKVGPIMMDDYASFIAFLHTTYYCPKKNILMKYVVTYDDGTVCEIDISGGKQIGDWYSPVNGEDCLVAWAGDHPDSGANLGYYMYVWKNPRPDLKISFLTIVKVLESGVPMILGISYGEDENSGKLTAMLHGMDMNIIKKNLTINPVDVVEVDGKKVILKRVDSVVADREQNLSVLMGIASLTSPQPPNLPAGLKRVANVNLDYQGASTNANWQWIEDDN
jgi:beta-galactosidase/beta-glucuronidase